MNGRKTPRAFTLVELLVVIGIIAILISILLPVVGRAQDQARSAACKSNLRQIFIATQTYANDNKGSLPYGFYWAKSNSLGDPTVPSAAPWVSWFTLLNRTMNPKANSDSTNGYPNGGGSFVAYELSKVFQCPGAQEYKQQVHYYQHPLAMPHMPLEKKNSAAIASTNGGPMKKLTYTAPARFTDLYNDNILFWDTPLLASVDSRTAIPFINPTPSNEAGAANNVLAAAFVDDKLLRDPAAPELRFRDSDRDLYAGAPDTTFRRGDQSIFYYTDSAVQSLSNQQLRGMNVDGGGNLIFAAQVGNIRFRHQRNSIANVAMADGSVQAMTMSKNVIAGSGTKQSVSTTIQRKMLQIRWPTGYAPGAGYTPPQ